MEKERRQEGGLHGPKLEARHKTGLIGEQELHPYIYAPHGAERTKC